MRVLVVEDEEHLAEGLRRGLDAEGFATDVATNGTDGLWMARERPYDAIVLDIMLPGINGYRVCAALREEGNWTPILMLTAKDGEFDEAEALDTGADDFVTKPFSYVALVARLHALIRRGSAERPAVLEAGDLRFDPGERRAWRGEVEVPLTAREMAVLEFLLHHRGDVVSKTDILDHVWDGTSTGTSISWRSTSGICAPSSIARSTERRSRPSVGPGTDWRPTVADRLRGLRVWARGRRPAGIRARVTATAVAVVGIVSVLAAFAMVDFVGRSLTAQAADQATVRAEQIADGGVRDGRSIVVADPGEQFVQVLRGSTVVASSANVAGLPPLAVPGPESTTRFSVPTVAGPFVAAAAETVGPDGPRTVVVGLNVDDIDDARHVVALALLIGVPLLLVVVGVVTWRMVGRTLRPVEDVREEVELISSSELDRRVPTPSRDDEVGRLARTMNRMLDRLERGQERQRRFISDASHELRSPVAAIRQHAEVAAEHPDSTNLEELTEVVLAEDARLQGLVDDLLVLARLDEHARPTRFDEVDLDDVVLAEAARLRSTTSLAIDTRGVSTARILGHRTDLERLVRNLTDNALHHARAEISLGVEASDGHVALTVDDDGPGIASADRERALERFVRLDGARTRASGGSGLGLSIVREVARAHQGAVVLGRSPHGGLRAEVRFPAP